MNSIREKNLYFIFVVSLILKGFSSILEISSGILFLFTAKITSYIAFWVTAELADDPTDFIATQIQHILPYFSTHGQYYTSFYLLSHGIVKLILVVSLLRKKLWAYPATIIVLFLFIVYQLLQLSHGYSSILIALTCLDILIIALTWHEYKIVRAHPHFAKPTQA